MELFANQPLSPRPHIAVFSSSKIGNFVVITPLLRGLTEKYPGCTLDFFGSDLTQDLEEHCPYIDWRFSLYSDRDDFLETLAIAVRQRRELIGSYDLAINCDEFSEINLVMVTAIRPSYIAGAGLSPDFGRKLLGATTPLQSLLQDRDWNSEAFLARHQELITSNYIAEIFCRVCEVETDYFQLEVPLQHPNVVVPDILIHVTATRSAKQWPLEHWLSFVQWCSAQNLSVGLIGHRPDIQRELYHSNHIEDRLLQGTALVDLRGQTSLTQLAGVLAQTKACVTLDTGPLHIAAAVGCPTVAIFGNHANGEGASPMRLWAPRQPHVKLALSEFSCSLCEENQFKNKDCLLEQHPCMFQVTPQRVIDQVNTLLDLSAPPINDRTLFDRPDFKMKPLSTHIDYVTSR